MYPITALVLAAVGKDSIEEASPLLITLLGTKHKPVKAHRFASAMLAGEDIPAEVENELPDLLRVSAESVRLAYTETRAIKMKSMLDAIYAEQFKRIGPHVHIELGRPRGSLLTATAFTNSRIGKLPEDIFSLTETEQYALVKQAIEAMMNDHGQSFQSTFTSLNGFTYHPAKDVCIWFDMDGKPA